MATLKLEIVTPEARTFSDDVDLVELPGAEGELGIYPLHVPLLTELKPGEVRAHQSGKVTELVVGTGFVEVLPDRVSILTDLAANDEGIDESAVEEAARRAEQALKEEGLDAEQYAETQAALAKSIAQLHFKRRRRH